MSSEYLRYLAQARRGRREAIAWLLEAENPWLLSRCRRLMPDDLAGAEDLVQDTCLRFVVEHKRLRCSDRAALRSWLWTVARNLWTTRMRSKGPTPQEEVDEGGGQDGTLPISGTDWERLWLARRTLPLRQDLAIQLRDYCGCDYGVIASILRSPTTSAVTHLRRRGLGKVAALADLSSTLL